MSVRTDLRYALRALRRSPEFTVTGLLTLGAGIGAVTAMFGVILAVLLRPLPVAEQDRLVLIRRQAPRDQSLRPFAHVDLAGFLERSRAVEAVAGVQFDGAFPYVVTRGAEAFNLMGSLVSAEFFEVLGALPAAGRLLDRRDVAPDAPGAIVISYELWQRRFGGDPAIIGTPLGFDYPRTIIGVAPRGFEYPAGVEMWFPLQLTPDVVATRDYQPFSLVARMRPGASIEDVRRDAAVYGREIDKLESPRGPRGLRSVVLQFDEAVLGRVRPSLEILGAAVVVLLLVAWTNVANLLLMRGAGRSGELALRSALGADWGDLIRPHLVEAVLLSLGGAVLALPIASWTLSVLLALAPPGIPRLQTVQVGPWAVAMVIGLATATMGVVGLGSAAWAARRRGDQSGLGTRYHLQTSTRGSTRSALVVCQVALALLLTAGAAVLAASLRHLQRVDMGFAADSLTLVKIGLPTGSYDSSARHFAVFDELAGRVAAEPGVFGVTPVILSPFVGPGGWDANFVLEGQDAGAAAANPTLNLEAVAPGYFETLGVPLNRGRELDNQDRKGSVPVAIVSQRLARRLWADEDPIGRRIKIGSPSSDSPWLEVVGVAGDTRYRDLETPPLTIYVPFRQTENPGLRPTYLAVRSRWGPSAILEAAHTAAREIDPNLLVSASESVSELRAAPLARPRLMASLAGAFAVLALGLAGVGVYGMVAMLVVQRTREFGVRMALGAQAASIRRLVLLHSARHALGGILIGLVVWLATSSLLRGVVYGLTPTDPVTLAGAAALLFAAALLASYLPAHRATRVDPAVVLRSE